MDLMAYKNIETLSALAAANGIAIPRLRGYRLMERELPLSNEELESLIKENEAAAACFLIRARWHVHHSGYAYCTAITRQLDRYLLKNGDRYCGIRWDRIHGKKRKALKFTLKMQRRAILNQYAVWNRYAGQKNVLYIHSRMGGWNWEHYEDKDQLMSQPWFLDRVDDWFDSTYCDFYARIREV